MPFRFFCVRDMNTFMNYAISLHKCLQSRTRLRGQQKYPDNFQQIEIVLHRKVPFSVQSCSAKEVGIEKVILVHDLMAVDNFNTLVVNFEVLVHVEAGLIVEEEFRASNLTHSRSFAGIFYFCQEEGGGWAVLIRNQVACVFCAESKVSSTPESRDNANVFVFVTS